MIPLKSLINLDRFPYINIFFIVVNLAVFIFFYNASSLFYLDYGVVSSKMGMPGQVVAFYEKVYPFFTYMFIHGGVFHLFFNLLFLYVFGGAVENRLGHFLYFVIYMVIGVITAMIHVFVMPASGYPMVGASGAIAGVMGVYLVFYPCRKIRTLIVIILKDVYAWVVIGFWFIVQIFYAFYYGLMDGGVVWWVHIGGLLLGVIFALIGRFKNSTHNQQQEGV